jgi:ABC-type sugar transport system substrate-binding protein
MATIRDIAVNAQHECCAYIRAIASLFSLFLFCPYLHKDDRLKLLIPIGVVLPSVNLPYFADLVAGIAEAAEASGVHLSLYQTDGKQMLIRNCFGADNQAVHLALL